MNWENWVNKETIGKVNLESREWKKEIYLYGGESRLWSAHDRGRIELKNLQVNQKLSLTNIALGEDFGNEH